MYTATLFGFPTWKSKPQDPKSFDLCCHVSSSDPMQFEGIRKHLTFTHIAQFSLQLYPRWQNHGLDLQLGGCQGQEISFPQNFPPFASFLSFPSSFLGTPSHGQLGVGWARSIASSPCGPIFPLPKPQREAVRAVGCPVVMFVLGRGRYFLCGWLRSLSPMQCETSAVAGTGEG